MIVTFVLHQCFAKIIPQEGDLNVLNVEDPESANTKFEKVCAEFVLGVGRVFANTIIKSRHAFYLHANLLSNY